MTLITDTDNSILSGDNQPHPQDVSINKLFEDLIEDNVDLKDTIALVNSETGKEVTYRDLNEKANKIARVLLQKVKKEDLSPNSDGDHIIALRYKW